MSGENQTFGGIAAIITFLIIMFIILGFVITTIVQKYNAADNINSNFEVCEINGLNKDSNMAQLKSLINSDEDEAVKYYNKISECYPPDDLDINAQLKAKLLCNKDIDQNSQIENFRAFNCNS